MFWHFCYYTHDMKNRNVGVDLLRILMTFAVVGVHCFIKDRTLAGAFAVPVFMTLAFYLSSEHLLGGSWRWLGQRVLRLYLPLVVWAVVVFVLDRLYLGGPLAEDVWGHCNSTWKALGVHLIGGTALCNHLQMWFIPVLIVLTVAFFLLVRAFRGRMPVRTLAMTFLAALMLQYSGFNKGLFDQVPEFGLQIPGGRILEMVPYACVGLVASLFKDRFAAFSVATRLRISIVSAACLAFLILNPVVICRHGPGFSYSGLQDILLAVAAIGTFLFLPLEFLPAWTARALSLVARYSMGVYMTHVIVARLGEKFLFPSLGVAPKTLTEVFVVFVLCWLFCFLLARIPACRRLVV